jgi:RNA polymerase sigma-70 factor (ECF subfamily)
MPTAAPDIPEPGDAALLLAFRGGDERAFDVLVERWEVPAKAFLLSLGAPRADVDDLAQEAFVRVHRSCGSFRAGAAFKPWFLTILANLARNRLRWAGRHPTDSLDALPAEPEAPILLPGSALDDAALAGAVRAAVDALPPPLREVVVLVELGELPHAEAAAALGCTVKAIETRLWRARRALRTELAALVPPWRG